MKPGYYLSESGNFQVWYPMDCGRQRLDVYREGAWESVYYSSSEIKMLLACLEFTFLGALE